MSLISLYIKVYQTFQSDVTLPRAATWLVVQLVQLGTDCAPPQPTNPERTHQVKSAKQRVRMCSPQQEPSPSVCVAALGLDPAAQRALLGMGGG